MAQKITRCRAPFWLAGMLALGQLPAQATTVNVRVTVLSPPASSTAGARSKWTLAMR